ncbi:unnamed protein product [Hermetia illucens]|uniref:Transmembrane protein 94 n=1 Tax=Hermetia illucens TaxID=343691 RepID=A0A7R8V1J4_HERIL|nr:transmembrane protein 94 isoform X1 [Hermetia illucens]CAD7091091.1 unnamed protein product [Hermetia illucens]
MKEEIGHQHGLSTKAAIGRLHDEIKSVLDVYEGKFNRESKLAKARSAFVTRYDSPLGWFSIIGTVLAIIGLFVTNEIFPALVMLTILGLNVYFVIRENNLRRTEIFRKVQGVLDELQLVREHFCGEWQECNYPHKWCPLSPCVSLQWTYRDGKMVNLPWSLLVNGDYIVMRPGQVAPGPCTEISGKRKFGTNEMYGITQPVDPPSKPVARTPLPDLVCILENTPFISNLTVILENSLKRPATIYNQQRYLLVTKYIQQFGFTLALLVTLLAGLLRFLEYGLPEKMTKHWIELYVDGPIATIIPILPLIFPIMWIAVNLWGIARLETFLLMREYTPHSQDDVEKSFNEDFDSPNYDLENISLPRRQVLASWISLWYGSSDLLGRSANVVQVLGSITALCCVDKKGILSWPNPTAEKVFFLHNADEKEMESSEENSDDDVVPPPPTAPQTEHNSEKSGIVAEVLDLTPNQQCPFKLEFDDHEWKNHITSLKPLGLAILLNTCSPLTHAHYAQFCGHVTAVAMLDKDLVPVTNRYAIIESSLNCFMHGRCLCELAKQIGFTTHATDIFALEGQLATYRHLQPEVVRRDIRFARSLQISSKVKVPFPHSLSVIMRESPGGYLSLFTQGTADIILDCCDDFWDGKDLRPLGPQDRKRAQDFYQRSALTAYCTAFSYRPLRHGICGSLSGSNNDGIAYLELPPESKYRMQHVDKSHCDFEGHTKLSHSISTDSLLFSDAKDEDVADVEGCFEMQCHQVFIGMITMQYQAQTDIVHLVERLERACIRFVHFSKENELRSRVFSEKLGLESGWNCHISLLSDDSVSNPHSPKNSEKFDFRNTSQNKIDDNAIDSEMNCLLPSTGLESSKTLSSSAPGAISNQDCNMLSVTTENSLERNDSTNFQNEQHQSEDSALEENCRSLSILTDSTEQSAPINFDMSNRAKLPRGIKNIRPHLEKVDNVPLQVSLFTDCSAEATREMLSIMQSYGEIVVCIGSSASNSNAEIFLQADCSIAVEPLYPQVCQDIAAYDDTNILNNRLRVTKQRKDFDEKTSANQKRFLKQHQSIRPNLISRNMTISPIYLSRMLNSIPCSISVCRDDPFSIVAIIELSRRFSAGLWNCIQFWACCGCSLAVINMLNACISLPPIFTPITLLYLMCIAVPLLSLALIRIELDLNIMNRATGKKQTKFDSRVFGFVIWCYGCKFLTPILVVMLSYCAFMGHPMEFLDINEERYEGNLEVSRSFCLMAIVLHFVIISASFVHRDHLIWRKNPCTNRIWILCSLALIVCHSIICSLQVSLSDYIIHELPKVWPIVLFLITSSVLSFIVTEICKWQEIKFNLRYQRRARLDFGTKLGMNSPF